MVGMSPAYRPSVAASGTEQGPEGKDTRPATVEAPASPHSKLVRDKIPEIIRSSGVEPRIRVAGEVEYRRLLRLKLCEEVDEFLTSGDPDELADVLEVLHALAECLGLGRDDLEGRRAAKADERGGFADRIVWSGNYPLGMEARLARLDVNGNCTRRGGYHDDAGSWVPDQPSVSP